MSVLAVGHLINATAEKSGRYLRSVTKSQVKLVSRSPRPFTDGSTLELMTVYWGSMVSLNLFAKPQSTRNGKPSSIVSPSFSYSAPDPTVRSSAWDWLDFLVLRILADTGVADARRAARARAQPAMTLRFMASSPRPASALPWPWIPHV